MGTNNPLTLEAYDPFIDFADYIGQRSATFVFNLIDGLTNEPVGSLTPLRDSVPTLSHDTSRTIKRSFSLALGIDDTALIDPIRHRVLLYMVMSDGRRFPLGRYMIADFVKFKHTQGDVSSVAFVDEMFILDQQLDTSFTTLVVSGTTLGLLFSLGANARQAMFALLERYDLTIQAAKAITNFPPGEVSSNYFDTIIDNTQLAVQGSWPAGISGAKVLEDLSVFGDYFSPWFDNFGRLNVVRSFNPADKEADFDFDIGNAVIRDSISDSNDLLTAPNRYMVISNSMSATNREVSYVGTYDIPSSAPHSIENRGFVVSDVRELQVTGGQTQVDITARNIGLRETVYERTELATPPDPRHDSYNVIRWQNELWLEYGWDMELIEGGNMTHKMKKVYV